MALPPRAAAVYVLLSKPDTDPGTPRDTGTAINSLNDMGTPEPYAPGQTSFYASQRWYQDYPPDAVAKVHLGIVSTGPPTPYFPAVGAYGNRIWMDKFTDNQAIETTYPDNIVYAYDPTPSPGPAEPVPDPNGDVGNGDFDSTTPITAPGQFYYPRWNSDPAYDVTNSGTFEGTVWPKFSTDYLITPNGFTTYSGGPTQFGPWSAELTVTNFQSKVLNQQTSAYEYYDFTQTTFEFKQTTKVKVYLDANICCWNSGTIISGTVKFQSVSVTTAAVGANQFGVLDLTASHNFGGMMVTTGSSATDAGTASYSVTVDGSYVPVEITIPTQSGTLTFINDFSVDSITPPA